MIGTSRQWLEERLIPPAPGCSGSCPDTLLRGAETGWSALTPLTEASGVDYPIAGSFFPAPQWRTAWTAHPSNSALRQTQTTYSGYDLKYGNLLWNVDAGPDGLIGNTGTDADNGLRVEIDYFPDPIAWLVRYPAEGREFDGSTAGALLGRVRFFYDGSLDHTQPPVEGLVTRRSMLADASTPPETELIEAFQYDGVFGNLTHYWSPVQQESGGAASIDVVYETDFNSFVSSTTNALSHQTLYKVDPDTGQLERLLEPTGYHQCWAYDAFGRLESRKDDSSPLAPASFENATCPRSRASFSFANLGATGAPDAQYIQAFEYADASNTVESRRYFDGLGRVYFHSREAEATTPIGEAGRFFRNRT